jgi:hypothetical protein
MADLARDVADAAKHSAAAHECAADPRGDRHVHEVAYALRGAGETLADRGHHGVAIKEDRRDAERRREAFGQMDVGEAVDVRRVIDDPRDVVEGTRRRARRTGEVAW